MLPVRRLSCAMPRGRREPEVGEELLKPIQRTEQPATEDILKVRERVDLVMLAGSGQGVEDHRRPFAAVASEEGSVGLADGLGLKDPLNEVVADAQLPVLLTSRIL
jgi:hypothetical protein